MKTKSLLLATVLIICVSTARGAVYVADGPIVNPANGHTYYLGSLGNWTDAETLAHSLGGELATINDAGENAWITTTFLAPDPTRNPYIGLVDVNQNFVWSWLSGEPVTYVNWAPGEPNFTWEHYSNLFPSSSPYAGQWNNTISTDIYYSIIEVVPEPSSLSLLALATFIGLWRRARSRG